MYYPVTASWLRSLDLKSLEQVFLRYFDVQSVNLKVKIQTLQ